MTARSLIPAALLSLLCLAAPAQQRLGHNIPLDVFYLMPSFSDGMVYFASKPPAQGKLNICAVDNTLRFLDHDDKELEAPEDADIVRVRIDTVVFLRSQGVFYRQYPVMSGAGIALRRDVEILQDVKQGAYGTTSRTSAIREYGAIYADGISYNLNKDKEYPFRSHESLFLYKGEDVFPFNKRNIRRLFPDSKEQIDAYFKSGGTLPGTVDEALALISRWAD